MTQPTGTPSGAGSPGGFGGDAVAPGFGPADAGPPGPGGTPPAGGPVHGGGRPGYGGAGYGPGPVGAGGPAGPPVPPPSAPPVPVVMPGPAVPPAPARPAPASEPGDLAHGPARLLTYAAAGLGGVVFLLGFFDDLGPVVPAIVAAGALLAAAATLPRCGRMLVPAGVLATVVALLLVQGAVLTTSVSLVAVAALVFAILAAASAVTAVLLDTGVVTVPEPRSRPERGRPAAPFGHPAQPARPVPPPYGAPWGEQPTTIVPPARADQPPPARSDTGRSEWGRPDLPPVPPTPATGFLGVTPADGPPVASPPGEPTLMAARPADADPGAARPGLVVDSGTDPAVPPVQPARPEPGTPPGEWAPLGRHAAPDIPRPAGPPEAAPSFGARVPADAAPDAGPHAPEPRPLLGAMPLRAPGAAFPAPPPAPTPAPDVRIPTGPLPAAAAPTGPVPTDGAAAHATDLPAAFAGGAHRASGTGPEEQAPPRLGPVDRAPDPADGPAVPRTGRTVVSPLLPDGPVEPTDRP